MGGSLFQALGGWSFGCFPCYIRIGMVLFFILYNSQDAGKIMEALYEC